MLEIDLYNRNLDFTFFSKKEIIDIKSKYGDKLFPNRLTNSNNFIKVEYNDLKVNYYLKQGLPKPKKNVLCVYYFTDGDIGPVNYLLENFVNKKDYTIIIVAASNAEAWLFSFDEEKERDFKNKMLNAKNFYLIHFEPFFKQERSFFSKKIALQNLLNVVPSVGVYHWMHPYFKSIKKDKRIGLHLNRINREPRVISARIMFENEFYKHNKMFFTLNKNNIFENDTAIKLLKKDLGKNVFDNVSNENFGLHTFSPFYLEDWYIPNLFDFSLKSDIEIVYETTTRDFLEFRHFTEKTIKHIMLGKPIFFNEPVSYYIFNYYGYKNYDCLYTSELLKKYKEYDMFDIDKNQIELIDYKNLQSENIKWLLEMSNKKWESLMDECFEIAEENYKKITKILYDETIKDIIIDISKI
jgi:hypothetical protein